MDYFRRKPVVQAWTTSGNSASGNLPEVGLALYGLV